MGTQIPSGSLSHEACVDGHFWSSIHIYELPLGEK